METFVEVLNNAAPRTVNQATWVRHPFQNINGSGGPAGNATSRRVVTFPNGVRNLRVVFVNWYSRTTDPKEQPGAADLTIKCSIEQSGLTAPVLLTFNGNPQVTIKPWGSVISDPIGIDCEPGDTLAFRTHWTVPVPGTDTYPANWLPVTPVTVEGWTAGDATGTNDAVVNANAANYLVSPSAYLGTPASSSPILSVVAVGDSIAFGQGDSVGFGFVRRATDDTTPLLRLAQGSDSATAFLISGQRRLALAAGNGGICAYGRNDVNQATTLDTTRENLIAIWKRLAGRGMKVWQTTVTPQTNSTDAWATTANQTIVTTNDRETKRLQLNAWIRDGAPMLNGLAVASGSSAAGTLRAGDKGHPLEGYFETADTVESARDSGLWAPNLTADGIHPNDAGHDAMAAAVDLAAMAAAL